MTTHITDTVDTVELEQDLEWFGTFSNKDLNQLRHFGLVDEMKEQRAVALRAAARRATGV